MKQVALITGGTRGIGLGIAHRLAAEGYSLVLCGMRPESDVTTTINSVAAHGVEVMYCQADVADAAARARLVATVADRCGTLNVLVNNAGVAPAERKDILDATEESFARVLRINLEGPYFLTQRVARWMVDLKRADTRYRGCIVNIGSVSATMASLNRGEYCIAKAGMAMATQLWAVRLADQGIPVYEVRPGITSTDMTAGVREKYDALIAQGLVPQKRWGEPDDVGAAVAALVRGDFPYSTGQVIMVDGGLTLQRL